jgi:hypothetical protein
MSKKPFQIDIGAVSGNSTANLVANATHYVLSNTTAILTLLPSSLNVGNSTVNTTINSTAISAPTANLTINAISGNVGALTTLTVGNGTNNVSANSSQLRVGNSTVNSILTMNSLSVGVLSVNSTQISGNGIGLTSVTWAGASYTVSTAAPSGGTDGNFWFQREA